jgi:hypothetical protein
LEIHWPASGDTQTFRDLDVRQWLEITESEEQARPVSHPSIAFVDEE